MKNPPPPRKAGANVLVIEDNDDIAETIGVLLMREGYGVRSVASREDGLLVLHSYLYDVIIMDLHMPGMDPQEFIRESRRQCPRSVFILLSADEQIEKVARDLKICDWIAKPFKPQDILDAVKRCVG